MSLIVEDGTGLFNAVSYVSIDDADAYHLARRNMDWLGADQCSKEPALIRGTAYIDQQYRLRFPGYRAQRRLQALEWPRQQAYYYQPDTGGPAPFFVDPRALYPYDIIAANLVPVEIKNATCEAALRELNEPGVLNPDLERGGAISEIKAGSVNIKYGGSATPNTIFQAIDAALSALIIRQSQYSSRASRV